jgi:hypothetical protein
MLSWDALDPVRFAAAGAVTAAFLGAAFQGSSQSSISFMKRRSIQRK